METDEVIQGIIDDLEKIPKRIDSEILVSDMVDEVMKQLRRKIAI